WGEEGWRELGKQGVKAAGREGGVSLQAPGCERDMLDPGNGADLYLNTAPHRHYISQHAFSQDHSMY
ncbi:hypothetical protein KUCAC02_006972, partial [Chaenocephalus aceratus]